MKKSTERRLLENEIIFKQVNTDVDDLMYDIGVQHQVSVPFYCECSDMHCQMRIELTPDEYQRIHANPKRFIVVPGHEVPAIEKVVERRNAYWIVEKLEGVQVVKDVEERLKELR